ncbi:Two-component response regulator ARR1 [Glycine soja]
MDTYLVSQKKVLFEFPVGLRVVAVDHDPTILDNILNMCSRCHYRARGQEKIGTNFKESDSDELDDSFAPPTKKPRLMWRQELHQQFVEDVMQIGLDSMINSSPLLSLCICKGKAAYNIPPPYYNIPLPYLRIAKSFWAMGYEVFDYSSEAKPKRIVEAMNIPGLTREQVASHLQKHRHELLLNTSKGVTLQQNEKTLSNNIESKRREGAYGRFDLTAFGDTSHLSYAALHPEERMEDQWPYYSLA